jgi:NADPH-dependent glutamate synthase beta subunit-like oxidoreductase
MIRSQIPRFRLPEEVIDEEVGYIVGMGNIETRYGTRIDSLKALLAEDFDAVFIGTGAPRGRDLDIPGRQEAAANIHIGIDWLSNVSFGHTEKIGRRVVVLGGGNTAMDCCRTARRLGGEDVKVVVRSGFEEMKASPWEKEDAMHEGIPILNYLVPKNLPTRRQAHRRHLREGRGTGRRGWPAAAEGDRRARRHVPATTFSSPSGRRTRFPGWSATSGLEFDRWGMPKVDPVTMQSSLPHVFFGGDAAFGPEEHHLGRRARARRCHLHRPVLPGGEPAERPPPQFNLVSQKMGIHEWSYDNDISLAERAPRFPCATPPSR